MQQTRRKQPLIEDVEGFSRIVSYSHCGKWPSLVRDGELYDGWWEYPSAEGQQAVEWETAPVPENFNGRWLRFVWTVILGKVLVVGSPPFTHHLFLNDHLILSFQTPPSRRKISWTGNGCRLSFQAYGRTSRGDTHGVMCLTALRRLMAQGRPSRLRVVGGADARRSFSYFILLGARDTVDHLCGMIRDGLDLVVNGKPSAVIVLKRQAAEAERFAAIQLRHYLQQMSGARLPIKTEGQTVRGNVVCVGSGARSQGVLGSRLRDDHTPDADRIVLRRQGETLALTGSNPRSVLFAVYEFLKTLGCCWLTPGEQGARIPRMKNIRVGSIARDETAAFRWRSARPSEDSYLFTEKDFCAHVDWLAKNALNWCQFLFPPYERLRRVIAREMRKRDLILTVGYHNFRQWVPNTLFAKHPEYFPEIDGRRICGGTVRCASSAGALKVWEQNAAAWAKANPEVDSIMIGCDDSFRYCRCAGCRPLMPIEQLQSFYNRAARAIHAVTPGKRIWIESYSMHYEPARNIIPYKKNVAVLVDVFGRCATHPLNSGDCDADNKHAAFSYNTPDVQSGLNNRYLCLALQKWRREFGTVTVFENVNAHARRSMPFPYPHQLAADLRYLKDIGTSGFVAQADLTGWEAIAAPLYVVAQLTWNPERDVNQVLDDFCRNAYGRAAPPMRRYLDLLEQSLKGRHTTNLLELLTPVLVRRCRKLLNRAENLACTPETRMAVRRTALVFEHTEYMWRLAQQRAAILRNLEQGALAGARRKHKEIVRMVQRFVRFEERYMHQNLFYYERGWCLPLFASLLNEYPAKLGPRCVRVEEVAAQAYRLDTVAGVIATRQAREAYQKAAG